MAGTKEGGLKAAKTNYKKYGKDFYVKNGAIGGRHGHTGGFAYDINLAKEAGRKGGLKSKRGNAEKTYKQAEEIKKLLNKGLSAKEIAKKIGLSLSCIHTYIRRFNLRGESEDYEII